MSRLYKSILPYVLPVAGFLSAVFNPGAVQAAEGFIINETAKMKKLYDDFQSDEMRRKAPGLYNAIVKLGEKMIADDFQGQKILNQLIDAELVPVGTTIKAGARNGVSWVVNLFDDNEQGYELVIPAGKTASITHSKDPYNMIHPLAIIVVRDGKVYLTPALRQTAGGYIENGTFDVPITDGENYLRGVAGLAAVVRAPNAPGSAPAAIPASTAVPKAGKSKTLAEALEAYRATKLSRESIEKSLPKREAPSSAPASVTSTGATTPTSAGMVLSAANKGLESLLVPFSTHVNARYDTYASKLVNYIERDVSDNVASKAADFIYKGKGGHRNKNEMPKANKEKAAVHKEILNGDYKAFQEFRDWFCGYALSGPKSADVKKNHPGWYEFAQALNQGGKHHPKHRTGALKGQEDTSVTVDYSKIGAVEAMIIMQFIRALQTRGNFAVKEYQGRTRMYIGAGVSGIAAIINNSCGAAGGLGIFGNIGSGFPLIF